ncbi:hypothetical protein [Microcoleus vaginatus]|uniref:hypothetical protein n=1 Tax=Microcoleus vaginatus TaxID=119532 RepID=UPI0032A60681
MIVHIFKQEASRTQKKYFLASLGRTGTIFGCSTLVNTYVDRAIFSSGASYKLRNRVERNIMSGKITATPARVGGFTKICK